MFKKATTVIVFDVESVGLHGVGFAYGAVVVDLATGNFKHEECVYCEPQANWGTVEGIEWVRAHCMRRLHLGGFGNAEELHAPAQVRARLWDLWTRTKALDEHTLLAADTAWPVEARFLAECVDDAWPLAPYLHAHREAANERYWQGPYPLIDISTLLAVCPDAAVPRDPELGETPEHDPLADARYSARQMIHALNLLEGPRR